MKTKFEQYLPIQMEVQGVFTLAVMFSPFLKCAHIIKKRKGGAFIPQPKACKQLQEKKVLMMVNFWLIQENYALNYKNVYPFNEKKPISTLTLAGCSQQEHLCLHWVPIYHACRSNQHSIHELIIMRQKKISSSHCQGNLSATIQTQDVFLKHFPTIGRLSPFEQPLSDWRQLSLVISSK